MAADALQQSEKKFRGFFENLSVGLVITDQEGLVQEANKAFCQLFQTDRDMLLGSSLPGLLIRNADTEIKDGLQKLLDGHMRRYRFQSSYDLGADRRLIANIAISALHDEREGQNLFYGIVEDVTALELAQAESDRL